MENAIVQLNSGSYHLYQKTSVLSLCPLINIPMPNSTEGCVALYGLNMTIIYNVIQNNVTPSQVAFTIPPQDAQTHFFPLQFVLHPHFSFFIISLLFVKTFPFVVLIFASSFIKSRLKYSPLCVAFQSSRHS